MLQAAKGKGGISPGSADPPRVLLPSGRDSEANGQHMSREVAVWIS